MRRPPRSKTINLKPEGSFRIVLGDSTWNGIVLLLPSQSPNVSSLMIRTYVHCSNIFDNRLFQVRGLIVISINRWVLICIEMSDIWLPNVVVVNIVINITSWFWNLEAYCIVLWVHTWISLRNRLIFLISRLWWLRGCKIWRFVSTVEFFDICGVILVQWLVLKDLTFWIKTHVRIAWVDDLCFLWQWGLVRILKLTLFRLINVKSDFFFLRGILAELIGLRDAIHLLSISFLNTFLTRENLVEFCVLAKFSLQSTWIELIFVIFVVSLPLRDIFTVHISVCWWGWHYWSFIIVLFVHFFKLTLIVAQRPKLENWDLNRSLVLILRYVLFALRIISLSDLWDIVISQRLASAPGFTDFWRSHQIFAWAELFGIRRSKALRRPSLFRNLWWPRAVMWTYLGFVRLFLRAFEGLRALTKFGSLRDLSGREARSLHAHVDLWITVRRALTMRLDFAPLGNLFVLTILIKE